MLNLFNLSLRGLTLFAKFSLILILARFLSTDELATYGIIYATIIYSLYIVGLDFYIYTTREYINNSKKRQDILNNHFSLIFLCIFVSSLIIGFFASFEDRIFSFLGYFICLLIFEFLSQEIFRILVAQKRPLSAGISLFFRHGLWVYVLITYLLLNQMSADLNIVLFLWSCGALLSIIFGLLRLKDIKEFKLNLSIAFLMQGLKIVIPFFIGTLAYRLLFILDRFYFESFFTNDLLAAYVLFSSICISMLSFADAGIFSFAYPKLIENNDKDKTKIFNKIYSRLALMVIFFCIIYSVLIILFTPFILEWIGNPVYFIYKEMIGLQIIACVLFVLSMVPHYALYAYKKDSLIIFSHISSAIIFVIFMISMHDENNYKVLQYGLIISFFWMLLTKFYGSIKVLKQISRT